MPTDAIFGLLILIFSVILHEVAHGYMANYLGDPTARLQGRLTLNPIPHIDPVGTILLPLILWAGQGFTSAPFLIGYAKPVPINPYNLPGKYDEALVAAAGPGTNLLIALIFGLAIRFMGGVDTPLTEAFSLIVIYNILLALFNLIPIPPLDGSKVLSGILPGELGYAYGQFRSYFERLGTLTSTLILIILFYYLLSPFFSILIGSVFQLITGVQF